MTERTPIARVHEPSRADPRSARVDPVTRPSGLRPVGFRGGFTIVEIIVVIVIIAVLAGVMVPRLGNMGLRHAENEAKAARGLLTSIAQRDALSSDTYALAFDPEASRLGLLALVPGASAVDPAEWIPIATQTPIAFDAAGLAGASADGQSLDGAWKIEVRAGVPRPAISLLVLPRAAPDDRAWQVDLLPNQLVATITGLESIRQWRPRDSGAADLDAEGSRETPW